MGERDLVFVAAEEKENWTVHIDLEPHLVHVVQYLACPDFSDRSSTERAAIRRRPTSHLWWKGQLFRRIEGWLVVVASLAERELMVLFLRAELGLWNEIVTQTLGLDRLWLPRAHDEAIRYVKFFDVSQRMKRQKAYHTSSFVPQSSLFEVLLIDFARPFPAKKESHRFLLVCVEHLTGWSVIKVTRRATADEMQEFMETKAVPPFEAPEVVTSDNAMCFCAHQLRAYMKNCGTKWRTVLTYAPMSNKRDKRMMRTIKT